MPIGSLPSRKTSDFQVTGSRSHSCTRWRQLAWMPPSSGGWIAIRSSRRASVRSTAAIARRANSVASSSARPITITARPAPIDSPATRIAT